MKPSDILTKRSIYSFTFPSANEKQNLQLFDALANCLKHNIYSDMVIVNSGEVIMRMRGENCET